MLPAIILVPAIDAIATALTTLAVQKLLNSGDQSSPHHRS
jgi:hypothetical protein